MLLFFFKLQVDVYPKKASAWYTVGCYYLLVHKYEAAQRYFQYVTLLWLLYVTLLCRILS